MSKFVTTRKYTERNSIPKITFMLIFNAIMTQQLLVKTGQKLFHYRLLEIDKSDMISWHLLLHENRFLKNSFPTILFFSHQK